MPFKLFLSFLNRSAPDKLDEELIKTLTSIRVSDYNAAKISAITNAEYALIKPMLKILGLNILKTNLAQKGSPANLHEIKSNLNATIDDFMQDNPSKFSVVSFAAQLLQYYTIICDEELSQYSLFDFNLFLTENKLRFGDTSKNLFIAEYKLIKLYNNIAELTDSLSKTTVSQETIAQNISYLSEQLIVLRSLVTLWVLDAPDNVFVHYLQFAVNYSLSKQLELEYCVLQKNPSISADRETSVLSETQQTFIHEAKKSLVKISALHDYFNARNITHHKGLEFSLGQNILNKLPEANLDDVMTHVTGLIAC